MAIACLNHPEVVSGLNECAHCGNTYCGDCLITLAGKPTCAACKAQNLRDLQSGTDDTLQLATRGSRLIAAFIDNVILYIVVSIVSRLILPQFISPQQQAHPRVLMAILLGAFSVPFLYEGLMLSSKQATLGKLSQGIIVVRADGARLTTGESWGRALAKTLFSIISLIDVLFIFGAERRCLHDRAASTKVIKRP